MHRYMGGLEHKVSLDLPHKHTVHFVCSSALIVSCSEDPRSASRSETAPESRLCRRIMMLAKGVL